MNIQLMYDPITGNITDSTGMFVATFLGLTHCEVQEPNFEASSSNNEVDSIIKLKSAGFTAEEIIKLNASI